MVGSESGMVGFVFGGFLLGEIGNAFFLFVCEVLRDLHVPFVCGLYTLRMCLVTIIFSGTISSAR